MSIEIPETFIKNRGITQTIIHDNNKTKFNEINWNADYDGNVSNILVNFNDNGRRGYYDITLDNKDLANMLNIPSVDIPLHKRLKKDFKSPLKQINHDIYKIELNNDNINDNINNNNNDSIPSEKYAIMEQPKNNKIIEEILETVVNNTHISSPQQNEEIIIPITIDKKPTRKYTLTSKRRHKKLKTHKTHKAYKKHKTLSKTKSKRTTKYSF